LIIIQYGGSRKETTIRVAFQRLLENYCDKQAQTQGWQRRR